METKIIEIPTSDIKDWQTFHDVFQRVLGFPDFYGRNMDAWNDCMSDLDDPNSGMTKVTVKLGGIVVLKINNAAEFKKRCPEQYDSLIECAAFVNYRRVDVGETPIISLMLVGYY